MGFSSRQEGNSDSSSVSKGHLIIWAVEWAVICTNHTELSSRVAVLLKCFPFFVLLEEFIFAVRLLTIKKERKERNTKESKPKLKRAGLRREQDFIYLSFWEKGGDRGWGNYKLPPRVMGRTTALFLYEIKRNLLFKGRNDQGFHSFDQSYAFPISALNQPLHEALFSASFRWSHGIEFEPKLAG